MEYMSAKETGQKWNISQRRVSILCSQKRIPDCFMVGNMWLIPKTAEKPADARYKKPSNNKENAHPFVKWAGGKSQLLEIFKDNLPKSIGKKINKYAEPFVGGGALLFFLLNEYSFQEIYISDKNKELINVYSVLQTDVKKLISLLKNIEKEYKSLTLEKQSDFYYEKRDLFNSIFLREETKIEKAALFIFLNKTCFNGLFRVNKGGKFNVPAGKYKNPLILDEKNLLNVSKKLKNVRIYCGDFKKVESFADKNTFVYFDPPYRPLNSTSSFTSYTENCFSDEDHIRLAEFFKKLSSKGVKLMMSNSDPKNEDETDLFFDELYKNFHIQRISAMRTINSNAQKRGKISELLIKNY